MSGDLPEGWSWLRLEQFAALEPHAITDGPFGSNLKTADYVANGEVRVIRLGNLGVGKFLDRDRSFVAKAKFASLTKHEARPGDLVVAALAEPVGRCVEVPEHLGTALVKADCVRVCVNPVFERRYLMHALNSPGGRRRAEAAAHGTGRLRINVGDLRSLLVPTAPPNEQRRIVVKLEALQARSGRAREALDAVPPLLEKLRQSILAAAFRGDLTKDWRAKNKNVEPATKLLERIRTERRKKWEESELAKMKAKGKLLTDDRWRARYKEGAAPRFEPRGLPAGWGFASIDAVGDVVLGRRRAGEEYVEGEEGRVLRPYVRVANVKEDRLDLTDVLQMPFNEAELAVYRLEPGDIILSEGQSAELVGQSATYEGGIEDLCIQATVHRFRALPAATTSAFAQLVFLHHLHSGVFMGAAALTTNIAHLTSERLKPLPFPLPPLPEQALIVERVRRALIRIRALESAAAIFRKDHQSLERAVLSRAFRGELVPQNPNDEPAEHMLARLRPQAATEDVPPVSAKRTTARRQKAG